MADELLGEVIKLREAANKIPKGFDLRFKLLDLEYKREVESLNQKTEGVINQLLEWVGEKKFNGDQFELSTTVGSTIDRLLDSIPESSLKPSESLLLPVEKSEVTIQETVVNGIRFIYSTNVFKPGKFVPIEEAPESIKCFEHMPVFQSVKEAPRVELINTVPHLSMVSRALENIDQFFVSMEIHRVRTYIPYPSVITIWPTPETAYMIDVFAFRSSIKLLKSLFESTNATKIFFDARSALRVLSSSLGIYPSRVFDLSLLTDGRSLNDCLENLGIELEPCVVDWRLRPLTPKLQAIALSSVQYLPDIGASVVNNYTEQEIREKMELFLHPVFLEKVNIDNVVKSLCEQYGQLDESNMAVLRSLVDWRDSTARLENESPNFVLPDSHLYAIASRCPEDSESLQECCQKELTPMTRSFTVDILTTIKSALSGGQLYKQKLAAL